MPATDILLVRHAESTWNALGKWQGQANPPLSDKGHEQAKRLADEFPSLPFTHLFSSDLQRAQETARPLAQRLQLPVQIDAGLRELDVGSWSGRSREEIHAEDPQALDLYFQGKAGWSGGETYAQHEARAEEFARKMRALPDPSVVVAVTHGGTLRALVLALLEQDHASRSRLSGIWHTGIAHLERGRHGYFLTAYNADARSLSERYGSQRTA